MINDSGDMIVNEFESFEALFTKDAENDTKVMSCLREFWGLQMSRLLPFIENSKK